MKDFDADRHEREQRDRQFTIGGETFTFRPSVAPESLLPYHRAITGEYVPTEDDWIKIYDEAVVALLEPGQAEAWQRARDVNAAIPLNAKDISDLLQWLLEQQTGRPTGRTSESSPTGSENVTGLKVAPSSQEVLELAGSASDRSAT